MYPRRDKEEQISQSSFIITPGLGLNPWISFGKEIQNLPGPVLPLEFRNHPQKSGLFEFLRINYGILLSIPIPTHPTSSQKSPSRFFPTIPTLQDPQQLKLGNFAFFILFNWIFQLHSLIFPLPWALLLEGNSPAPGNSQIPTSGLEFQLPMATSHCR